MSKTKHRRLYRFVVLLVVFSLCTALAPATVFAAPPADAPGRAQAVESALNWLLTQQSADGPFGGSAGTTAEVVLAAAAAQRNPLVWHQADGISAIEYLRASARAYATDAGSTGKLLAAVSAAEQNPRAFGGIDLIALLHQQLSTLVPGSATAIGLAWAAIGLASAGEQLPAVLTENLLQMQQPDGGWEWGPGFGTDSNTTAIVLQALAAAGLSFDTTTMLAGYAYLRTQLSPQGGFTYSTAWGDAPDANSTAVGIQALAARGNLEPNGWSSAGMTPVEALLSWQLPDGAFEWQPGEGANLLATAQAIPALLGKALPIQSAYGAARRALTALRAMQQPDGSFAGAFGSNLGPSAQALLALASAGENPADWKGAAGASLLDYLTANAASVSDTGTAGRLLTGLVMAGINPYSVAPALAGFIKTAYIGERGTYDAYDNTWNQALAIWGLRSIGAQVPQPAVDWLINAQNEDGGWGWAAGQTSDTNSTAIVMQALSALGYASSEKVMVNAISYLWGQQTPDGGFAYDIAYGAQSDANSTAVVMLALWNAGVNASAGMNWTVNGGLSATPLSSLLALQLADGSFEWQAGTGSDLMATAQAIPALLKAEMPERSAALSVISRPLTAPTVLEDTLQGNGAGAFNYYTLRIPGTVTSIGITLSGLPGDIYASRGLGLSAYTPEGILLESQAVNGSATLTLDFSQGTEWIVRVYNYLPNLNLRYTLSVETR